MSGTSRRSPELGKEGDEMRDLHQAVRDALGQSDGYLLDWRLTGCQLVSREYRALLRCPYREAIWRCEVIGAHTRHRWSEHLIAHERMGNGYSCASIGDGSDVLAGRRSGTKRVVIGL